MATRRKKPSTAHLKDSQTALTKAVAKTKKDLKPFEVKKTITTYSKKGLYKSTLAKNLCQALKDEDVIKRCSKSKVKNVDPPKVKKKAAAKPKATTKSKAKPSKAKKASPKARIATKPAPKGFLSRVFG